VVFLLIEFPLHQQNLSPLISAFNILLHTVHTHLLKLEVHLIFQLS
jgi:hypothetical protein